MQYAIETPPVELKIIILIMIKTHTYFIQTDFQMIKYVVMNYTLKTVRLQNTK